ncbi:MAG: hypothetical protein AAF456_04285 [Planctomycetota bacterium]
MRTSILSKWLKLSCAVAALAALSSGVATAQEQVTAPVQQVAVETVHASAIATADLNENKTEEAVVETVAPVEEERVRLSQSEIRQQRRQERILNSIHKTQEPVSGFDPVDMFTAMNTGEIEVVIKTKNAAEANVIVTNTSDRPLAIQMPAAFASVPVMRQIGGGGLGGGGLGGGGGGLGGGGFGGGGLGGGGQFGGGGFGGGQGGGGFGGGGFGGGGLGGGRGGGGGGIFNIPAGRDARIGVNTVCLEHGRPDPALRMDYTIVPLEMVTNDPKIFEIVRMVANDEINQPSAQAAAWHLTDELSWEFLATKNRIERMDGSFERYFSLQQVLFAQQVITEAHMRAEQRAAMYAQEAEAENTGQLFEEEDGR